MAPKAGGSSSYGPASADQEETKGLLAGHNKRDHRRPNIDLGEPDLEDELLAEKHYRDSNEKEWSRAKVVCVAISFIVLLIVATFTRVIMVPPSHSNRQNRHPNLSFNGGTLRSNGTHDFRRTVLVVSIDGLRADYLDRGLTPHLLDISKKGLRAKSMRPIFPTLTFPNHWALMTGLYAESHGIVANNFWDPISRTEFHYNKIESCWNPSWWLGEPMWETAGKASLITANLMWPGPPKTTTGAKATYFVPWKNKVALSWKLDQLLKWIDLPLEERPQLLLAYEPSLDQAGHSWGPNSARVNHTLSTVDAFARDLHLELEQRNLTDIVDVVFVSDHGMTDTSDPTLIFLDDIIGKDAIKAVEHEDGWPAMGLRFRSGTNETDILDRLLHAQDIVEGGGKFHVYTHDTMPERWHFTKNARIAPFYLVPEVGYVLTTHAEVDAGGGQFPVGLTKGGHGYDNSAKEMQAMFVAHGPFSAVVKALQVGKTKGLSGVASHFGLTNPNQGWHSTGDDTYVMETFQNVEIYSLVMKLLGIEDLAAPTNGTSGFWDVYF